LYTQVDWEWDAGDAQIAKAIALEPGNAEAYRIAGYLATTRGQFDKAIELLKRAISLDPLQPWNYIAMGFPVYRKRDYAEAEVLYRKAIALSPQDEKVHYVLGTALLLHGQLAEALAEMEREPDAGFRHCGLALAFDALGRKREAEGELSIAETDYKKEKAYWIALIYASRRDVDNAFLWLDRAASQKDPGMLWIRGDPMLDVLVNDPRYDALLRRINLLM
jgi:tetratricopeptide (TPR) repeat protein